MKSICLTIFLVGALAAVAGPVKIELPAETGVYKLAPGSEIANGQCLTCHSVEYVTSQPKMAKAFWAASVKKMQEKYGAPVPMEQVEPLVEYLTQNYGIATNTPASSGTNVAVASVASKADAKSVAIKYGCLTCHSTATKLVGPSYKEIADKYRKDSAALTKVSEQIHKGGSGKWGPVIMPPFPQVTEGETKLLADWILGQN